MSQIATAAQQNRSLISRIRAPGAGSGPASEMPQLFEVPGLEEQTRSN